MKEYTIPVVWTVTGRMKIKSESLAAALLVADASPLPENASYMDDSFEVDYDGVRYLNPNLSDEDKDELDFQVESL
jgi:hypothetical protein